MKRAILSEEHELFRKAFRQFIDREVRPRQQAWFEAGVVDREVWRTAGEMGFLCPSVSEEYGGVGADYLYSVVVNEELSRAYETGFMMGLHSDIVVPYIDSFGSEEQKRRWLPGCVSGELIAAVAMTEPNAGSDLAGIKATAVRDGDDYVVNGTKTFISNGLLCDVCVVAVKTDRSTNPHQDVSLIVVEDGTEGFTKSKRLKKIGMHSQDTAELAFADCRVPVANRLGSEGAGFKMLMQKLQQERLTIAIGAQALAEQVLADTITYVNDRQAFGKPLAAFQNTRFKLAECATAVEVGRHFLDQVIARHTAGEYLVKECSMAKLYATDTVYRVADECLQLHGGYGYMLEYPVARAFADARVQRIFAGTNEIMKVIIAKQLGL